MFYSAGTESVTSESYEESLGMLAPIWLNEQIPRYFVIFRLDDPSAVNNVNADAPNLNDDDAQTSKKFTKNLLEKCTAIKTFDLTANSKLGNYLRTYRSQKDFPTSPLTTSWRKDEPIQWNGISYKNGGFTSVGKFSYDDLITQDTTIINNEYFFTKGFEQNGVIVANLINMQFLFNDDNADDYSLNRYFGLYVNDIDEGEFDISGEAFYKGVEKTQTPKITSVNEISEQLTTSLELENPNGILIYLDPDRSSTVTGFPTPARVNEVESIFYVKDKNDNFHTIKKGSRWGTNELRLFDKKIDISVLTGYKEPDTFSKADIVQAKGKAMMSFTVNGELPIGSYIKFYDGNNLIGQVSGDPNLATKIGDNFESYFNTQGTTEEIARSIRSAINNGIPESDRFFTAYVNDSTVYVISRFGGSRFNQLNFKSSIDEYPNTNIVTYPITSEEVPFANFVGGTDKEGTQLKVEKGDEERFSVGKFIKTDGGFTAISGFIPYTLEPIINSSKEVIGFKDIDKHILIQTDENQIYLSSTNQVALYDEYKPKFGRFSIFPIRDFDFDFYSEMYGNEGELAFERSYYTQSEITPTNTSGDLSLVQTGIATNPDIVEFYEDGGFATLIGILKDADPEVSFNSVIESEYERLEENFLKSQAVASRVIPYINKWSYYKEGKDVRNNPYRLNLSEAFTLNNFAPSKYDYNRSPYGFSHEWYYLAKTPKYFTEEAIRESWSYFTDAPTDSILPNSFFNTPYIPGTFQDTTRNYFDDYFIVDKVSNLTNTAILDRQLRYGTFNGGDSDNFAEAFLRGVKIIAKPKALASDVVNFNAKSISYVKDGRFNGYRFSAMLVPNMPNKPQTEVKVIKNDKWKTIVMLISLNLSYECINDGEKIIDRTSLYSLNSKIVTNTQCEAVINNGSYEYGNTEMQGALSFSLSGPWPNDTSKILLKGQRSLDNIPTRFLSDITLGSDGSFTDILFTIGSDEYRVTGIERILDDSSLVCSTVLKNGVSIIMPAPTTVTDFELRQAEYVTENGGYRKFENRLNNVSFAAIARAINQGDPNIIYETIDEDGNPVLDDNDQFVQTFLLELRSQDDILKSIYVGVQPDKNKPTLFNLIDIIGYDLTVQKSPRIVPISRHSGNYEPIANDIIFFKDPYIEEDFTGYTGDTGATGGTGATGSDDYDYKIKVFNLTRHANTQFNSSKISTFGQLKNYFYHKVNVEDPSSVLELSNQGAFKSVYPLINEVGIDKKDFYIFSSNWEPSYFRKSLDKNVIEPIIGTRSMTEKKSFFGSKAIKIPDQITLETFSPSNFIEDAIKQPSLVNGTFMHNEDNVKIELYIFIQKQLVNFLFSPIKETFIKYINPAYGFGDEDTLDDDVRKYIEQNILKQYKTSEITLYTKSSRINTPTDYTLAELNNNQKQLAGLTVNNNFSSRILNTNQFDTRLIYNKRSGFSESIGFSITLVKK
jgi:hypothetical protein